MKDNYRFGGYFLETDSRSLLHAGKIVRLSPKAFQILLMLITHQGQVVSKDDLLHAVWSDSFVEENNLAVHISALRRVLGENLSDTKHIETISGIGYRFLTKVETVRGNDTIQAYTATSETDDTIPNTRLNSIAVLPFNNKSGDPRLDYLAEGIAESLILNLSQLSKLKVISYSAVAGYKNKQVDIRETGFLLGVEAIVSGSISEINETLEISVELVQVSNLAHLWGMQYHRSFEQLLKTRTEISLAIAESLHLRLNKTEERQLSKKLTDNSEAYKLYLKGLNLFEKRGKQNLLKSVEHFEKAVELDEKFALAYAALGDAYLNLAHFFVFPTQKALLKADEAINRAIDLDANLSEAYSVKGLLNLFGLEIEKARASLEKAMELNPNNSMACSYYSIYLAIIGKKEKSIEYQYRSIELSPFVESRNASLSTRYYLVGEYEKAIQHAEEAIEIFPTHSLLHLAQAYSYAALEMFDEAMEKIEIFYSHHATTEIMALKAYVYARKNEREKSLEIIDKLLANIKTEPVDLYDIGIIYGSLGYKDKAFEFF